MKKLTLAIAAELFFMWPFYYLGRCFLISFIWVFFLPLWGLKKGFDSVIEEINEIADKE